MDSDLQHNRFIVFSAPSQAETRSEPVPQPKNDELLVETICSAVSAGTELLVYRGELPDEMALDATIDSLKADGTGTKWPVRYGYAAVGRVTAIGADVDPAWHNRLVFAFHPHASHLIARPDSLICVPDGIEPEDAVFLPNMETAVSFVMDSRPLIGETAVVLGLGIVGQLTLSLLAHMPLGWLIGVDRIPSRRETALQAGATAVFDPADSDLASAVGEIGADVIFELSGNPHALNTAVALAGYGSRVLIGSWYGKKQAEINLGGEFHRSHIQLFASQVSRLHPHLTGRWTKQRRLDVAWRMIRQQRPSRLVTHRPHVSQAASVYEMLDQRPEEALQVIFQYR